jgi:serine phosphatase RsbU (regulator of sigma subunit)
VAAQFAVAAQAGQPREDIMARERLERKLQFAHTLQSSLTPEPLPEVSGYRLAARRQSSLNMGGDFYDVLPLRAGRLALAVGSTSGDGDEAGVQVAQTLCELRGALARDADPAGVLAQVNRRLVEVRHSNFLLNLALVVLDPQSGDFTAAGAGTVNACLLEPDAPEAEWLDGSGETPLGILTERSFHETEGSLSPASALVLHTDGLLRCLEHDGPDLETRLRTAAAAPDPLAEALLAALRDTAELTPCEDDVTVLTLQRG